MKLKATLQCVSVGVLALLTAAWVAGFFGTFGYGIRPGPNDYRISFEEGSVGAMKGRNNLVQGLYWISLEETSPFAGRLFYRSYPTINGWSFTLPLTILITAVLPVAYASFYGFQFRLWHYFIFTAIIAVQLACYLRPM
jgi:hypothetical protein